MAPSGSSPYGSALQLLTTLSLLAFFSLWGLLTREGLVALNTYHGQSIQPLIWAQAIGCLVMGWAIANKGAVDRVCVDACICLMKVDADDYASITGRRSCTSA
jgi:hypothetical protein